MYCHQWLPTHNDEFHRSKKKPVRDDVEEEEDKVGECILHVAMCCCR